MSHSLGFITIGVGGLTAIEMEDVLSCDDLVLNTVYRYDSILVSISFKCLKILCYTDIDISRS